MTPSLSCSRLDAIVCRQARGRRLDVAFAAMVSLVTLAAAAAVAAAAAL